MKLSVKSLYRCKCVCKSWRQLLCELFCEPQFVRMHLNHVNQHEQSHQKLLLQSTTGSFYSVDFEARQGNAVLRDFPLRASNSMRIWGSCNGMICFAMYRERALKYRDRRVADMVLWNPSTGDYKMLPSAKPSIDNTQKIGFGYDSSVDDYKMVRTVMAENIFRGRDCIRVDLYSLKTDSWKIIQDVPAFPSNFCAKGVCANGSIYWLLDSKIIGFDLKTEKFRELSLPRDQADLDLVVMGGCLGLYHYIEPWPGQRNLIVWSLKEHDVEKDEWIKLMTVTFQQDQQILTYIYTGPLCYLEKEKVLWYRLESGTSRSVQFEVQDLKGSNITEPFSIHGISDNYRVWVTYIESLVSPTNVAR